MITPPATVLVVGATGSIGRLVVDEAPDRVTQRAPWSATATRRGDCKRMRR
jgi:uncharacterized protein YbjT (DUF2867 family)